MKILALRGENLAALEAPFDLNFAQPPLKNAGIFAICGPTGSGKSTLLDALCLALYNKTPRLLQANQSRTQDDLTQQDPRQLLRRGALAGYAEVVFVGQDQGHYRARWKVQKTHAGAYKKVEMRLNCAQTDQNLGGNLKETLAVIVEKVGLDFEQFRRTVLLAQNDFTAFLKSDPQQKAELLEAITGNQIYSQLSIGAYERQKLLKTQLEIAEQRILQYQILSEDEFAYLQDAIAQLKHQLAQLERQQQNYLAHQSWGLIERQLIADRQSAEQQKYSLEQQVVAAVPRKVRLETQRQLRSLKTIWQSLHTAQSQKQALIEDLQNTECQHNERLRQIDAILKNPQWSELTAQLAMAQEFLAHKVRELSEKNQHAKCLYEIAKTHRETLPTVEPLQTLLATQTQIANTLNFWENYQKTRHLFSEQQMQLAHLQQQCSASQHQLVAQAQEVARSREQSELAAQKAQSAAQFVDDIVLALRAKLMPEHPCPVCGSREHPLANQAVDALKATFKEYQIVAQQAARAFETAQDHHRHQQTERDWLQKQLSECTQTMAQLAQTVAEMQQQWEALNTSEAQLRQQERAIAEQITRQQTLQVQRDDAITREREAHAAWLQGQEDAQTVTNAYKNAQQNWETWRQSLREIGICIEPQSVASPDADSISWTTLWASVQQTFHRAKQTYQETQKALAALDSKLLILKTKLQQLEPQITECNQHLQHELTRLGQGIDDLEHALAWDETDLQQEIRFLENLATQQQEAETIWQTLQTQWTLHQQRRPVDPINASVKDDLERLREQLAEQQAQQRQHLQNSENRQKAHAEFTALTAECQRWDRLHQLIGSHDGQKFRSFAQGLTLERLLHLANHHLHAFAPRYQLQRLPPPPQNSRSSHLEMQVIDLDMGGARRSIYSLSGGELFLTSLALALALADTISHLHLASLFIDEGFGSLDADTLTVALNALDRLQQQGRQIGLISHVHDMADRIGVQIHVRPKNGKSDVYIVGR